jgi:hypothetical protein
MSLEMSLVAERAATAAVEQHRTFDLPTLADFVGKNFPQIPEEVRPYLVIGAAAGARHVAQVHYVAEAYRSAPHGEKLEIFNKMQRSLASWSLGIRHQNPPTPLPPIEDVGLASSPSGTSAYAELDDTTVMKVDQLIRETIGVPSSALPAVISTYDPLIGGNPGIATPVIFQSSGPVDLAAAYNGFVALGDELALPFGLTPPTVQTKSATLGQTTSVVVSTGDIGGHEDARSSSGGAQGTRETAGPGRDGRDGKSGGRDRSTGVDREEKSKSGSDSRVNGGSDSRGKKRSRSREKARDARRAEGGHRGERRDERGHRR